MGSGASSPSPACCSGTSSSRRRASAGGGGGVRVAEALELDARQGGGSSRGSVPVTEAEAATAAAGAITLVTQCSEDRVAQLAHTAAGWGGHVVAAVLLQSSSVSTARARIRQQLLASAAEGCRLCVLLCVQDRRRGARSEAGLAAGALYPINALRNLALAAVRTELLLLVDVDQVPSARLAAGLAARGPALAEALLSSRTALVVPAFEPIGNDRDDCDGVGSALAASLTVPQLDAWRRDGTVVTFGAKTYPRGHGSTDEDSWLPLALGEEPTPFDPRDWPRCRYAEGYEPYLILSRVRKKKKNLLHPFVLPNLPETCFVSCMRKRHRF